MGTLWYGGKVRTLENEHDSKEAVFVKDGIIRGTGTKEQLLSEFKEEITRMEDIEGAVMYPGFTDSHLHMVGHGEKLLKLDLSEIDSIDKLKNTLLEAAASLPPGEWLVGEGFNENLYADAKVPDRYILDEVTTEHPIILSRVCRHALVTNSYGLELAGITPETPEPSGGIIVKDNTGIPTGYLLDQAQELIREAAPSISLNYVKKALGTSIHDLLSKGFVGGHTEDLNYYGDPSGTLAAFHEKIDGVKVKFRANLLIHHEVAEQILSEMATAGEQSNFVEAGSVKIFADGALGGRTALLSEPYADDATTKGVAIYSREELQDIVRKARNLNMPIAVHTIGDAALELAIDIIEKIPPVSDGQRDRLIHIQVAREDLIDRMKKLPVILDLQPRFVASDFPWVIDRLGKERMKYSFAWKTLLDAGLICAGGSDAPIEPVDPLLGIHAAVTRRKPEEKHEGYYPEQKLTLFEALRLYTYGSAQAVCKENEQGLIKSGYTADFTVLSEDLFELEPDEWLEVKVEKTVVDDTVMYDRQAGTATAEN
ncbi:amidohydrolase [Evansella sp. LMS18]|uniref:amidohydrolase n=1 Tax=Evansella sp. LMS18 TaxID=2924033 RepID=UPI0020D18D13|nr:amidohydrolase [Evansella sp. LMS18]UTR11396.1 amidohydrolase [Evansella sp. LMS18]